MSSLDVSGWNVGDSVRLTEYGFRHIESNAKPVFNDLPTGVIVEINEDYFPPIGVSWDVMPGKPLHDCKGRCVDGTGWYVCPDMIEKFAACFEDADFEPPQPMAEADFLRLAYDCAAGRSTT